MCFSLRAKASLSHTLVLLGDSSCQAASETGSLDAAFGSILFTKLLAFLWDSTLLCVQLPGTRFRNMGKIPCFHMSMPFSSVNSVTGIEVVTVASISQGGNLNALQGQLKVAHAWPQPTFCSGEASLISSKLTPSQSLCDETCCCGVTWSITGWHNVHVVAF